jgi:hypothetical protein
MYTPNCKIVIGFKMIDHRSWDRMGLWEISLWDAYYAYGILFLDVFEHCSRRIRFWRVVLIIITFNNVIIIIMKYLFPRTLFGLSFQFEPNNNFAILQFRIPRFFNYYRCAYVTRSQVLHANEAKAELFAFISIATNVNTVFCLNLYKVLSSFDVS